jgi:hypothetical protein
VQAFPGCEEMLDKGFVELFELLVRELTFLD